MSTPAPGTFWYDFLTGPALGGLGALGAALVIGGTTLLVSRHRRRDADRDRDADQNRTRREEWFRRLQWAHSLTRDADDEVQAVGYEVIAYLAVSDLATADDLELLYTFTLRDELVTEEGSGQDVDSVEYFLKDETNANFEPKEG